MWQNESVELTINKKKHFQIECFSLTLTPSHHHKEAMLQLIKLRLMALVIVQHSCSIFLCYLDCEISMIKSEISTAHMSTEHSEWNVQCTLHIVHIAHCAQCTLCTMQLGNAIHNIKPSSTSASSEVCIRSTSCDDVFIYILYIVSIVYCALYIDSLWPFPRAAIFSLLGNK